MKAFILLSDAARPHPDGTFSLLRGGIGQVQAPQGQPIKFRGSMVVRIKGTLSETGEHDVRVRLLDEDGHQIPPEIGGTFSVPEGGGAAQIVADFDFVLPRYGRFTFAVSVDRLEQDTWEVTAIPPPETSAKT
jgi:hypothetical protein